MSTNIEPAFSNNNIPVVFASDEQFVPVMAVMIQSIIENSSVSKNYDLIVLTTNISNAYKAQLQSMVQAYQNFSIRVFDISVDIEGLNFYTANRETITAETYYRLLLPELMPTYKKTIYLDGDMVANADVAELFEVDLDGYYLASSRDADGIGRYYKPGDQRKDYRDNVLKLKNPDNYFCAGMLVMNLELLRKELPSKKLLEVATSFQWQWHDQDVLNVLCEGKVKLVDMAWDVLRDAGNNQYMPREFYEEFLESERNPKIVHYGGVRKPWLYFDVERGEYFWRYAGKTPFYKQILSLVNDTNLIRHPYAPPQKKAPTSKNDAQYKDLVLKQFEQGKIGFRYIWKYIKAWINYKIKYRGKK